MLTLDTTLTKETELLAPTVQAVVDTVPVDIFNTEEQFFDKVVNLLRQPDKSMIGNLNVHASNLAHEDEQFKQFLLDCDVRVCDGVGIQWASKLLKGPSISAYHVPGEYLPRFLKRMADEKLTVYFLGWEPGIIERALPFVLKDIKEHTVVGYHHGYFLKDEKMKAKIYDDINRLAPDLVIVGMGMPIQEFWCRDNIDRLNVKGLMPLGGLLDYYSKKVPRWPIWVKRAGLAWFFRLCVEPRRMFKRYVVGNPQFLSRVLAQAFKERLFGFAGNTKAAA
jgi:N-acetylglucosaminyldiphosphoundecaprenol N-acetyl-beta-D-mannosaminyltransferase